MDCTSDSYTSGRRPRLLIISQQFPSNAKPTHAVYNKQTFEALAQRFDVKIIVPVDWITWLRCGKRALSGTSSLEVHYTPYFYIPGTLRRFTPQLMAWSIKTVFQPLLQWKPDAVLASWAYPDAAAVRKLLGASDLPMLGAVHGSDVHIHCRVASRREQVVSAFNTAAAVFSVSDELRSQLIDKGVEAHRIFVNYNGVDDLKFFPIDQSIARAAVQLPQDREIFLFVGNLIRSKGPFDLLEAYKELAKRGRLKNATVVFVGRGQDQSLLELQATELEAQFPEARIFVRGAVPHEQINQWMNAADYLCLPSHSEGVPNVVLEAMRCGIPVLASRVGGIPEVLDESCGVLVPARDVDGIADGLEKIRATQWQRDEICSYSRKFDWTRHADFFHQVLKNRCQLQRRP